MKVHTETGSVYEIRNDQMRRTSDHNMRRDEDWLTFTPIHPIQVGEPMRIMLEPLGHGNGPTIRITTPVTRIQHDV